MNILGSAVSALIGVSFASGAARNFGSAIDTIRDDDLDATTKTVVAIRDIGIGVIKDVIAYAFIKSAIEELLGDE